MPELESLLPEYADPEPSLMGEPEVETAPETPASSTPTVPVAVPAKPGDFDIVDPVLDAPEPTALPEKTEVTEPIVPAAVTSTLSPELQQRAAALGMTPDQLAAYPNAEVAVLTAENIAFRAQQATLQSLQQQQFAQQQPKPVQLQPPKQPDLVTLKANLVAQGYEEKLADAHVDLAKQTYDNAVQNFNTQRYLQDLHGWATGTHQQIQAQATQHQVELAQRDFEDFRKGLEPEMAKLLDPNATRQVWSMADALLRGYAATLPANQMPTYKQLFEQATYATLGPKIQGTAREQVRAEVRTAQGRAISRPRGADAPRQTGDKAAGDFANKFYAKLGLPAQGALVSADI